MADSVHIKREVDRTIQRLIQSPRLPLVMKQFEAILQAEQEKRRQFYAEMSEGQKVEFITGEIIVQTPAKYRHVLVSGNLFTLLSAYVKKVRSGGIQSRVIPGFDIPVRAVFDPAEHLAALQAILA